jgi:hypothetical protein
VVSFDRSLNGKTRRFVAYSAHPSSCESPSNCRVSSIQTKNILSWNRNEPKLNLFRFFGLFHETKNIFSVCFGFSNLYQTETNIKRVSKQTEKIPQRPYTADAAQPFTLRCSTEALVRKHRHNQVQHKRHRQAHTGTEQALVLRHRNDQVQHKRRRQAHTGTAQALV